MKSPLPVMIWLLFALVAAPPALARDWQIYENPNAGFSLEYPAGLFATEEPSKEGDGIILKSADGEIELRAYAFNNGDELPLAQIRDIILADLDGREVTYKRIKNNWMVLSGYESGSSGARDIFYQRLEASPDRSRFSVFEIIYPETRRAQIDGLIARIGRSLTAPKNL